MNYCTIARTGDERNENVLLLMFHTTRVEHLKHSLKLNGIQYAIARRRCTRDDGFGDVSGDGSEELGAPRPRDENQRVCRRMYARAPDDRCICLIRHVMKNTARDKILKTLCGRGAAEDSLLLLLLLSLFFEIRSILTNVFNKIDFVNAYATTRRWKNKTNYRKSIIVTREQKQCVPFSTTLRVYNAMCHDTSS